MIKVPKPKVLSLKDRIGLLRKVLKIVLNPKTDTTLILSKTHCDEGLTLVGNYANGTKPADAVWQFIGMYPASTDNLAALNRHISQIGVSAISQFNRRNKLENKLVMITKPIKHVDELTQVEPTFNALLPQEDS